MTDSDYQRSTTCPRCGAPVPEATHWATWCDQCDWNVVAGQAEPATLRFLDRAKRRVADRAAGRLSRGIESDPGRVADRPSRAFELGLSLVALAGYAGVGVVGALAAVGWLPLGFWRWPLVVFCVLLLWALRPHGARLRPEEQELSPDQCLALHEAIGLVATAVQAPIPECIAVTLEPRVNARPLGLAGGPALVIGLSLWAASGWEARTAMLAHEIAHGEDRQSAVGKVVATARQLAWDAVHVMWPVADDELSVRHPNRPRPLSGVANAVQRGFALPLLGFALLMDLAGAPVRMAAEYRADAAAARAAGTRAAVAALAFLTAVDPLLVPARSAVRRGEDPWATLEALPPAPDREVERLTRASRAQGHHVDGEHPPTWMRFQVLRVAPEGTPQVTFSPDLRQRVDAEMAALQRRFDADFRARLTA